jgi:hypothetical protein
VQTWNAAGGYGSWSSAATFTLQTLAVPTLLSPSGYTPKPAFQFRWNAVPGATHHYLRVVDAAGVTQVQTWYTLAQTGCTSTTICSITLSPTLSAGAATWFIQPWNATAGYGPWSAGLSFTPVEPLPTPTLISASASASGMPVQFRWNAVPTATHYYLWVTDASGVVRVQTWYSSAATSCSSGSTCSITLTPALDGGTATWWVQANNGQITSAWSAPLTFAVSLLTPTLIGPSGVLSALPQIEFRWTAVPGATEHYLWVTDGSGTVRLQTWYRSPRRAARAAGHAA